MRFLISFFLAVTFLLGVHSPTYASDWDVAGKILAGIEGMRILSGGKVDFFGTVTGINRDGHREVIHSRSVPRYRESYRHYPERIWAPDYVWQKKWVPKHTAYDEALGEIIVEGHYIKHRVEAGGHWGQPRSSRKHSRRP